MDLQRVLDGLDRCDAKLDAKIAGVQPYRTIKKKPEHYDDQVFYLREAGELPKIINKKNLVCFDEAHNDTAYDMRMTLKDRIEDEIHWMNSESKMPIFEPLTANITIAIDALEQLHIDWHAIFKSIWEAAIKYACESKICH
ncbi:MAG: hypothetical protein EZS28_028862 [Streblomastix strix]|uniref:Uncharacterized protein n=1 Tax=Streblomastix strix TaxID=222440 RepID=A0A5J4UYY5_9EUKA|nr:MAG: hypothetical protein EZS28_028862 [Streblomastix strix]